MKELTIPMLIQLLPMSEELRKELQANHDSYNEDKKFEITRILWDGFDELYEGIKAIKTEQLTKEVAEGKRHISGELSEVIEEEVWKEIENRIEHRPEDEKSLSQIRDRLEKLIKEK